MCRLKQEKLSDLYDNASKTIFEIANHKRAPSEKLKEASAAVLNGAVNLIRTVNFTRGGEKVRYAFGSVENRCDDA